MSGKDELLCQIGISHFEGIGPQRYRLLKKYFGSVVALFSASKNELLQTGLNEKLIDRFIAFRKETDLSHLYDSYQKKDIQVVTEDNKQFPQELIHLSGAPFILYARGDLSLLSHPLKIGIVGTRSPTRYGVEVTKKISSDLSCEGFCIVSGMAMGVDAIAHRAALNENGKTIAVLGCGVDICYPAVNRSIYDEIIKRGLIISEFPPGTRTSRGVFPSRNRIVAGLSKGILVTEGAEKSGSLITARFASEYGKDVFAIPGPITSRMSGATTLLIKEGAIPVSGVEDISDHYKIEHKKARDMKKAITITNLSPDEQRIVNVITAKGSVSIDELTNTLDISPSEIITSLSELELKGIVGETAEGEYSLTI